MARLLFVKTALGWPRVTGHDVHSYNLMRALARLGHQVSLATRASPVPEALDGLSLAHRITLGASPFTHATTVALTSLQSKFSRYYGVEDATMAEVGQLARSTDADAVIAVGLDALPLLAGIASRLRVWYAADEWAWHHLSQVQLARPHTWRREIVDAAWKGLYERAFASVVDRVWVVSAAEQRAMRWLAGIPTADIIVNGVDAEFYEPSPARERPESAIFWGRLDFGPNVQALEWFCRRVWPGLRAAAPNAVFTIAGYSPSAAVRALSGKDGVVLRPNVDDLRPEIGRHALAVLPFVSGAGIKNKLLEGASLGKAIVCTPRACRGLASTDSLPVVQVATAAAWRRAVLRLWHDPRQRHQLGASAREWVCAAHSWEAAAAAASRAVSAHRHEVAA